MGKYIMQYTDGKQAEEMTDGQAAEMLNQPNVSDTYTTTARCIDTDEDVAIEAAEVYGEDKTPADYPDGDPYAPAILIAPDGYHFDERGNLRQD